MYKLIDRSNDVADTVLERIIARRQLSEGFLLEWPSQSDRLEGLLDDLAEQDDGGLVALSFKKVDELEDAYLILNAYRILEKLDHVICYLIRKAYMVVGLRYVQTDINEEETSTEHVPGGNEGKQHATELEAKATPSAVEARANPSAVEARSNSPVGTVRSNSPVIETRSTAPAIEARSATPAIEARPTTPANAARPVTPAIEARPTPAPVGAIPPPSRRPNTLRPLEQVGLHELDLKRAALLLSEPGEKLRVDEAAHWLAAHQAAVMSNGVLCPTVAGMLLFGRRPHLFLPGMRIEASIRGHQETWTGSLEQLCSRLSAVPSRLLEQDPDLARALVLNSLLHRSWSAASTAAPIRLTLTDDRLELRTPGRLHHHSLRATSRFRPPL